MNTVGLLGARISREIQRLRQELRRRGAKVIVADVSGFPSVQDARITLEELRVGRIDLASAQVWLYRQLETPKRVHAELSQGERADLRENIEPALVRDREVGSWLESLVMSLCDVARVVNHPDAASLHGRKPLLGALLDRADVRVPESLCTTDRAEAQRFIELHDGKVICKAAGGGGEARIAVEVLKSIPAGGALRGPLLFQRRIVGPSLRAYVVGERIASCARVLHGDVVDWRADQQGLQPWTPDAELESMLLRACASTGLDYAGLDIEIDSDSGLPYVLDVNPAPLFASYEQVSGNDIAGPLARLLIDFCDSAQETVPRKHEQHSSRRDASPKGRKPRIGLIGPRFDDEVLALSRALRPRDVDVRALDFTGLPGAHELRIQGDEVSYDGRSLSDIDAYYVRRLRWLPSETPLLESATDAERWEAELEKWFDDLRLEREIEALIWSAASLLDAPLINTLPAQLVHPRKVHHLRTLAAAGVPIPSSVATNDREAIRGLAETGPTVLKPLRGLMKTQLLDQHRELPLEERPVLVQRHVPGVTVRVYAVAGRPVAAAEMLNEGHVDSSVAPLPAVLTDLTATEIELVRKSTRAVNLPFTGMDLQRPKEGGPTRVLECNAAPMFANFCRRTGADVAGPLAEYLIHRAHGGSPWERES